MDFDIEVKKDSNCYWFYIKDTIRRYLPISDNITLLPTKLWQKYNYYNINLAMILPNNIEYHYNGQIIPNSELNITYPENPEYIWETYKNKKGIQYPSQFTNYELYGIDHYYKNNTPYETIEYPPHYGIIIQEMDDIYIMDENADLHRIINFIPQKYLIHNSWSYYVNYCRENKIELFAELNEYFQFNFYQCEVSHKGEITFDE
jgi:hypothetical protein